jgi:hypothetical protein
MREMVNVYKVLVGKPERKRPFGRTNHPVYLSCTPTKSF